MEIPELAVVKILQRWRALLRAGVAASLLAVLSGCAAVSDVTGAIAGFAAGAATANPAIGIGVGIAVKAATREGIQYVSRRRQQNEQDAIAAVVAETNAGESRSWGFDRRLGGDSYGEVRVLRVIDTPLTVCKEVAFSVSDGGESIASPAWFTTIACRADGRWSWAAAEPAVGRWRSLQ